ncbi:MAG: hypothetical protein PHF61_05705, partial [Bacteroidales bacterium]|nr:hypothetical protein [Bacteroidales bacterium]
MFLSFLWSASFHETAYRSASRYPRLVSTGRRRCLFVSSSLHRQRMPASARFGRRVYISASGRQFRYSTLSGLNKNTLSTIDYVKIV